MEVLGWVRSAGVQMAILWPLYFLTGALNGMEGSTLGGIVGKTLLLVLLNSFIKGVVIQTRGQGGRRRNFWNQFKANASNALLTRIPQFFNMKKLWNAGLVTAVGCGLLGLAAAVADRAQRAGSQLAAAHARANETAASARDALRGAARDPKLGSCTVEE